MTRADLRVDTFYRIPSGEVFLTPDGFGGFWYESVEEAIGQHGELYLINIDKIPED